MSDDLVDAVRGVSNGDVEVALRVQSEPGRRGCGGDQSRRAAGAGNGDEVGRAHGRAAVEHADAVVAGIGDVDVVGAVGHDARRGKQALGGVGRGVAGGVAGVVGARRDKAGDDSL